MAKKTQKRQLQADSNEVEKVDTKNHISNDAPQKKKLKPSFDKSEKKDVAVKQNNFKNKDALKKKNVQNAANKVDVTPSANIAGEVKLDKKQKKKPKKQQKTEDSAVEKTDSADSKKEEKPMSKRQEMFKQKRAEHKEKQKLQGFKESATAVLDKLSLPEMKKRIAEIESREKITKTATRKLRILKKKVQVLEAEGSTESSDDKVDTPQKASKKNEKNKLQNKSVGKKEKKQAAKKEAKSPFIVDTEGNASADDSENDSEDDEDDVEEKVSDESIENENESEEEDSDEDIDESESANEENKKSSEDNNEAKSKLKDVKKDKSTLVAKAKNAQQKSNQDPSKPKPAENSPPKKQRYVLFVGNISYDTTADALKQHFLNKVSTVRDVRIPLKPGTNAPRGFAYVEVENSQDYEKALSLHNTFVNGRKLNVEYTASGSKKGNRNPDVIHKNKKLQALRKDGKLAGNQKFSQKRSFRRNFNNNPKKEFGKRES